MSVIFGIDPGTNTGVACWSLELQKFLMVASMPVHRALHEVAHFGPVATSLVVFEDARKRQWFGHTGREVLQGAGAAKRDAKIWEEFLEDRGLPYLARKPTAGSTKWKAVDFARITGWQEPTNEHARDAGVLVYGFKPHEVASLVRSWEQARANTATRTRARG